MQAHLNNGSLSVSAIESFTPSGIASSERLADLFLELPVLKAFKRGRYAISKLGSQRHLVGAVLQAWKEFGGKHTPNLAVVELKEQSASEPAEGLLLSELFNERHIPARVVPPDELEYANGRLHASGFEIDIVFRRIRTRDLLIHFNLSHPLLLAYRDRAICVVNSFRSDIGQRPAVLDLLTDETVTARLSSAERTLIRNSVPWTRVVAQKKTNFWDQEIDLPEFIRRMREKLVLRPNEEGDAQRVFVGAELDQASWDRALHLALRTPYVVQERTSSARQIFPLLQYRELQMKEAEIYVHPYILNGRVHGASAVLRASCTGLNNAFGLAGSAARRTQ